MIINGKSATLVKGTRSNLRIYRTLFGRGMGRRGEDLYDYYLVDIRKGSNQTIPASYSHLTEARSAWAHARGGL
jgi:hypothetical protein